MPHAAGGHRWVELVLRDHSTEPEIGGVVCNLRDVTERRRLLGELEERNAFLASLAVSSSTALFEQDSVSGLAWANENWEEITGVSVEDSLGDRWRSLFEPGEGAAHRDLEGALPGPEPPTRLRLIRPDGEQRWLDLRSTVLPADDQGVVRRIGGIEDVTQVVESEAARGRLTAVFDATDDLVILAAPNGEVVYANRAAQDFLGPSVHDLADNPALAEVVRTVDEAVFVNGRSSWRGEVVLADTTGSGPHVARGPGPPGRRRGTSSTSPPRRATSRERIELEQSLERQATARPAHRTAQPDAAVRAHPRGLGGDRRATPAAGSRCCSSTSTTSRSSTTAWATPWATSCSRPSPTAS